VLVKADWNIFKAKFSDNSQWTFEWFCYLLFCKEYNQPYGIYRYTNQSGIETDPIQISDEVIGWQSKFYEDSLSKHKDDLIATIEKAKRDNPNITKIIFYTNSEFGQGQGQKEPKAKIETEQKAKESGIEIEWRTESYFESIFVSQTCRDISRYFFEQNSKWELSNLGFQDVLHRYYTDKFQTISFLIHNNQKSIEDIYINLSLIEDDKKEDIEKVIAKESFLDRDDFPYDEDDFIDVSELMKESSKSLIYGAAGIGKTTLCKYIAYMWSKGELYQEFDYVIYIPLRQWKNGGLYGAIKDYYYSADDNEITLDIKRNNEKILFLFDGYDELSIDKKAQLKDEIDKKELTYYVITARPYGYEKNAFLNMEKHFETVGFTPKNVHNYIDNFFVDIKRQQGLKDFLESNMNIKAISYIPLMLEMICYVWKNQLENKHSSNLSSMSMTSLYQRVVELTLKDYAENKEEVRVYNTRYRKKIEKYFLALAFEGLKSQKIFFDYDFLEKIFIKDEEIEFFENHVINSGFLESDCSEKALLDNSFEFLHLTFQEYFAALYVSRLSEVEQRQIIAKYKFYPHFQVFFVFLSGLIENKALLFTEISSEPKDIIGLYELLFMMNCLVEVRVEELNDTIIKNINDKLKRIIDITSFHDLNYEIIFDNWKKIAHIIDESVLEKLFGLIELAEDEYLEEYIVDTLYSLMKYHQDYEVFLKRIELESTNHHIQKYISDLVNNTEETEDKVLQEIIKEFRKSSVQEAIIDSTLFDIIDNKEINLEVEKTVVDVFKRCNILNYNQWIADNINKMNDFGFGSEVVEEGSAIKALELNSKDLLVDSSIREDSIKVLNIIKRNDDALIEELLKLIKDKNMHEDVVSYIFHLLEESISDQDYFVELMIQLWEDKKLNNDIKFIALNQIEVLFIMTDKITDIMISAFKQDIYYAFHYFEAVERYDNHYIDEFISLLQYKVFYEAENLSSLAKGFAEISEKNFYAFESLNKVKVDENLEHDFGIFLDLYYLQVKTSLLFKEYDTGEFSLYTFTKNLCANQKALFIEDNKLCTIEDGEKISTKMDVYDQFLNRLNEWFKEAIKS